MKHSFFVHAVALNLVLAGFICAAVPVSAGGKRDGTSGSGETVIITTADSQPEVQKNTSASPEQLRVGSLNGPTGIPVAYLYENPPRLDGITAVTFESFASPAALLPKMLKGEIDIGFLPPKVAAKVYSSSNKALVAAAVSGNGTLSLITRDPQDIPLTGLRGKKVAVAGQGATPEYPFRYLLAENGIKAGTGSDSVDFDFSVGTPDIAAALISGKVSYAVVPEPFATVAEMKSPDVRRTVDFQKEYEKINGPGTTYPLTLLVVRRAFAQEYPDTVRAFLDAYRNSTSWTLANPRKAGVLVQKHTLGLLAPVVAKAIPSCHFVCTDAVTARPSIEKLLGIFLQFAPESVGGSLPDDGFYFK